MNGQALPARVGAGLGRGRFVTRALLAAPLALVFSLSGCVTMLFSAPTTSYVDEGGKRVALDWGEFPGTGGTDPEAVLAGPTVETAEARATEMLNGVKDALAEQFGGEWRQDEKDDWHGADAWTAQSNGYGGASLTYLYNSPNFELRAEIPTNDWDEAIALVEAIAERYGLSERFDADLDPPHDRAMRNTTLSRGGEFLDLNVLDLTLDAVLLAEAKQDDSLVSGISLMYGVSAIREADRAEFERRVEPFLGQEHPDIVD